MAFKYNKIIKESSVHCEIDLWCILLGVCEHTVYVCLKQCAYHQKNMQQYNRIIEQQKSIKCFSVVSYSPFIVMFSHTYTHTHLPHGLYSEKEQRERSLDKTWCSRV